jgi:hypothetical protein
MVCNEVSNELKKEVDFAQVIRFTLASTKYVNQIYQLGKYSVDSRDKLRYYSVGVNEAYACAMWLSQILDGIELDDRGETTTEGIIQKINLTTTELENKVAQLKSGWEK